MPDSFPFACFAAPRYDRATDDVEKITGTPATTIADYIAANPQMFS